MKKSIKFILLGSVLAVVAAAALLLFIFKDSIFNVPTKESYTFINPDPARAETDAGMKIDGVFEEAVYSQNTWTYLHNANGGNTVDLAITSYFGEKGIYFAYEVRESTPIYVNMDRASWMNSCIEMYLVPSSVEKMPSENIFEIDLLPTGYLLFKRPNAAGGWSDVSTTHDKMAYLGAKPFGGEVNTDECTGYDLELFIPYDYLDVLGVDAQLVKDGYVNINPCHITSYNEDGTDGSVDRFWYSFGKQLGGDGWNDVNRYFKFNAGGAMGTVPVEMEQGENCTISGKPNAIPGLNTTVTITPDAGFALTSILCNGEELLPYVNYQEDGSAVVTLPTPNEGFRFAAAAEPVRDGNKTLTGIVELKNIFGDTFEGVSASYEDASGQHKLELSSDGSFLLGDIPQGYYILRIKKDGYLKTERTLCVNRDLNVVVEMPYDLFQTETGNCWNVSTANDGVLTKINGTGSILTKNFFDDFYVEANFAYSEELSKEFKGDDYQQQRMGVRVKFDNGKYWHIDLLRQNDGKYHLQFGKILGEDSLFNWDLVTELTAAQIARYQSEEGIKLGVLRMGRTAYIYLDNALVGKTDLGAEQAGCKAQIGFESFVSNGKVMTVPFALDVAAPAKVQLTDAGSVGATASLSGIYQIGETVTLRIHKNASETDAKLLSVQVNGKEMAQDTVSAAGGYQLTIPNNLEKVLSVKVIYAKPAKKTVELDVIDTAADGISVRLKQDGSVKATAIVQNGKAVFTDIYQGTYVLQVRIWGVWTDLGRITILEEDWLQTDVKTLFETPEQTNYTGNVTFSGTNSEYYSISADVAGDAWFAMKLQMDKAKLEAAAANKGNIRLGYRMFFGGYEGNYEWENEYEITLKYTPEGNWVFEQMNTWQSFEIPAKMVEALTGDGLYMALHRDQKTGVVTLHYGATEAELLSGQYACKWENEKHKENIRRFGVGFWSEKGSDYKASVSNLRYGTSLSQLLGIKETTISLQLTSHKDGTYSVLPENTQVLVSNAMGEHRLTADGSGKIHCQVLPGRYTVSVDGYTGASIEVPQSGIEGQLALEYDLFHIPTGWDTEKHDFSKVNDSNPVLSMVGGTMNVLTNDSFSDVSASLWVKESNSNHSAHTQGIWIRFEDGKYMILYQEDAKLAYMQNLWDFETVQNTYTVVCENLPEATLAKWSADGYSLSLTRTGNQLYVTADGLLCNVQTLPEDYADDRVQIGFFAYDSAETAQWQFEITTQIPSMEPGNVDAVIASNTSVEDGTAIRLLQDDEVKAEGSFADNQACFENMLCGEYDAEIQVFGYWAKLGTVNIIGSHTIGIDVAALFENADTADFDGNISFESADTKHYSVASDIAGDAWFTMKVQVDKEQLDAVAANKGNVRLGYRMFFGGYKGNYEWENEYEITLKYTPEGNWVFEQMNTWQSMPIPAPMVEALTADGLYMALHRNAQTGVLTLYCGATEEQLQTGIYSFKWETMAEKQKETIRRFGVGFWLENGSAYKATVSDLCYGTSFDEMFDVQTVAVELEVSGHKNGNSSLLPEGTKVLLQNAAGNYQLTVDNSGRISGQLLSGNYSISVDSYRTANVEIPANGLQGQLTLEYDLFSIPTGWDAEKHDFSKVNNSNPVLSMVGGTMNVLTNDSFSDVSASLWVKESNSNHSAHTQGIWIRFEDGKYMILHQEDAKLAYMQNLWDFETVQNAYAVVCESLPNDVLNKWTSNGYELRLIRRENRLFVMADGTLYHTEVLPEMYADDQVQIGFFAYDSAAAAGWNFKIQSDFPAYSILCNETQNGVVSADKTSARLGETVTFTVMPESGYLLKSLMVNGKESVQGVIDGKISVTVLGNVTVDAVFESAYVNGLITSNIPVENGTAIRLLQDGAVVAEGTFTDGKANMGNIIGGRYDAEILVFGYWAKLKPLNILSSKAVEADVAALFENPDFADFDGNISFEGAAIKHCSVAADIPGDAWFTMKVQVDKAQLNAVAANRGNVRLGYRLFFGGESGNYLWENEFEPTLKYTAEGRWAVEQMNSWEGWDYYLSDEMVNALTGNGLYLALHRNAQSGVLTLYYGATQAELLAQSNSFTYAQKAEKHKETITRFGTGFWSENGSDYQATVSNLRYSTSLQDSMETFAVTLNTENVPDSTAIRFTQNGKECVSGAVQNGQAVFDAVVAGSYQVEVKIFNAWSPVTSVNVSEDMTADIDVLSVFENREFTNFDGNISFTGTTGKNYSAATDISGDAWFAMKVQIDKAQLDAVAANTGNIRLGFRMFFGGEPGNSQWANEYELTLKYTAEGRWIVEQMQSWEGWNYYLSQDAIHALTGDGLYIAMHRNVKTGVLTLYYGASKAEMLSNSFTYSQVASKHKENITRFGVAFWSEKGSDYTVTISDLCYGATLEDATQQMQ